MLARVSSKGHLIIPLEVRESLGLRPGTELELRVAGQEIILKPIEPGSAADRLYGRFPDVDFLTELEAEHRRELDDESAIRP